MVLENMDKCIEQAVGVIESGKSDSNEIMCYGYDTVDNVSLFENAYICLYV